MKHIDAKLNENVANTRGTLSNVHYTEKQIIWEHQMDTKKRFSETMLASAVCMSTDANYEQLDAIFQAFVAECVPYKDMREAELNYLGELHAKGENEGFVKKNGRFGKKLHVTAGVSLYTEWIRETGNNKGYDTEDDLLKYLRNDLDKETMSYQAKACVMHHMGTIIDECLKSDGVDASAVSPKLLKRNKIGELKWGAVMSCVFWMGLAYKTATRVDTREDGTTRSFGSYVEMRRARLDAQLRKIEDEQWEAGAYLIDEQAEVEELEERLYQACLIAPFAEQLFIYIDMWNAVEEWSWDGTSGYDKIILSHMPKDQTVTERREDLEKLIALVNNIEDKPAKIKGVTRESYFAELKRKAHAASKARLEVSAL